MLTLQADRVAGTPATDLGYLLHKHPDRVQEFTTTQGTATVFYPEATPERCRAVLHVDGDGVTPERSSDSDRYVNDLPYAASSRLVVAIGKVFGDALAGRCTARPELADMAWPLTVRLPAVRVRGPHGPDELFGPLGWTLGVVPQPLTPPEWGDSDYATITLTGTQRVSDALRHLCVLLPALSDSKHYFVSDAEVERLLHLGAGWLATHPLRAAIVETGLKRIRPLADDALARLGVAETTDPPARESLARKRLSAVVDLVRASGARSVLDVGCGEGRLLAGLAASEGATRLAGVDVSTAELRRARGRLERWRSVDLWQSSLMYRDPRCRGFDTVVLMEVIEHIDPDRLPVATDSVFGDMEPETVIVTTPNRDHNSVYGVDGFRHPDHRFEFSRSEFAQWAAAVAAEHRYAVELGTIGEPVKGHGSPTQTAVLRRIDPTTEETP